MQTLHDQLVTFAQAIVHGVEMPRAQAIYPHYQLATALAVYRQNYWSNLHNALAGAYPVIEQLVGKDFFRLMTRHFIAQHPSRSGNLHHYGSAMAGFIAAYLPVQDLAYLPDIAALEWACHDAYFAVEAAPLDLVKLSQLPPSVYPKLRLHVHPACQVVHSRYPIIAIWQAHQADAPSEFHIAIDSGPCIALVSRKNYMIQVSSITTSESAWLHKIQAGTLLGEATDETLAQYPDFDLPAALLKLAANNVLTDFALGAGS